MGRMSPFANLLESLVLTPSRNAKLALLVDYFRRIPDPARGWALAALTGGLDLPGVKAGTVRGLIEGRMDPVLFAMSYDYVGDLAETVSLVWPDRGLRGEAPPLDRVVETLREATRAEGARLVEMYLDQMDPPGRWALLKLVTGGLRVGISARLARVALAEFGNVDVTEIEEIWHGLQPPYTDLFAWLEGHSDRPAPDIRAPFRPVMLAHPLVPKAERDNPDALDPGLIRPETYLAEWKWDGIRIQLSCEGETRRLYTRTGEDISHAFPDVIAAMDFDATLDGELLVRRIGGDGGVAPFNDLQQRLNRKTVSAKQMVTHPAFIRAYDLLRVDGEDLRTLPFEIRRARLEDYMATAKPHRIDLSPMIPFSDWATLATRRSAPPAPAKNKIFLYPSSLLGTVRAIHRVGLAALQAKNRSRHDRKEAQRVHHAFLPLRLRGVLRVNEKTFIVIPEKAKPHTPRHPEAHSSPRHPEGFSPKDLKQKR